MLLLVHLADAAEVARWLSCLYNTPQSTIGTDHVTTTSKLPNNGQRDNELVPVSSAFRQNKNPNFCIFYWFFFFGKQLKLLFMHNLFCSTGYIWVTLFCLPVLSSFKYFLTNVFS